VPKSADDRSHPTAQLAPDWYLHWRGSEIGQITDALETALVVEMSGGVRDKRVLDVGCGDGRLAARFAASGADVTGIDTSASMIAAAREGAASIGLRARFCRGSAEALPFPDGAFDLVAAITVLCFIADPRPAFAEAYRVLAPGGRLVVGELGRCSSWAVQRRIRAWSGDPVWSSARFRTAHELRRAARQVGFRVPAVRGAVFYPRITPLARAMRKVDPLIGRLTTVGAAFICMAADR